MGIKSIYVYHYFNYFSSTLKNSNFDNVHIM